MIERDIGDDTQFRGNEVGAVQTPAQPDFYHREVHLFLGKVEKSEGGGEFKEGRGERFKEGAFVFHEVYDALFGNGFPVDADALAKVDQMR